MYFYVDESGHTGPNLFDSDQPMLYYGVLSSTVNIDVLVRDRLQQLRSKAGVERLHAAELGNGRLVPLVRELTDINKRFDIRFDLYRIAKTDHAVICFFDQVFDQGVNPAVTWTGYWTPLRYVLLTKLAFLFDLPLAARAWNARIDTNNARAELELVSICKSLRERVGNLPDARSRELIGDALKWAEENPSEIYYNVKNKMAGLQVTPNIVGFQAVMHGIAHRINKRGNKASKIVVDQQSQFNKAQKTLHEYYIAMKGASFDLGPGLPTVDYSGMPKIPISFSSSADSAGLELVDVYLWIFKRAMEGKRLAPELSELIKLFSHRSYADEISINAIVAKWDRWFKKLPALTSEQFEKGKELLGIDEERRLQAIRSNQ